MRHVPLRYDWIRLGLLARVAESRAQLARLLRIQDDWQSASLAWPGAHPLLAHGEQLDLFTPLRVVRGDAHGRHGEAFDPTAFQVRPIPSRGKTELLENFFGRWHYEGAPGMRGPAFGLYWHGMGREELVGLATFARVQNPNWGAITFRPTLTDLEHVAAGRMSEQALRHRLVAESEYQELNRLALVDRRATRAPLLRGASSWFVAQCLRYFELRNRALWIAQYARENGLPLTAEQSQLLEEAQLDQPRKGRGFVKSIVSFSDPWEGHVGFTYQALGFHYVGRTGDDGEWEIGFPGLRSKRRISKRTIQKANNPRERGHDTAVLRLVWEGGDGEVRVRDGEQVIHTDDGAWIRSLEGEKPDIDAAWGRYQHRMRERFGSHVTFETTYAGGGVGRKLYPSKHRYIRMLGAAYWQHEVERRCVYLAERMAALDTEWKRRGWGPRPDTRASFYPKSVARDDVRPDLVQGIVAAEESAA